MQISLYHIPGISRQDIISRTSMLSSEAYLEYLNDEYYVDNVEVTYFPIYYTNRLRLEYDITGKEFNYLCNEYNGKLFFYYVSRVTYVSESIIMVDIIMDSINTFYNDINLYNIVLERAFIPRYNGSKINRDYIRENISEAQFELQYIKRYTKNTDWASWIKPSIKDTTPMPADLIKGYVVCVVPETNVKVYQEIMSTIHSNKIDLTRYSEYMFVAPVVSYDCDLGNPIYSYIYDGDMKYNAPPANWLYSMMASPNAAKLHFIPFDVCPDIIPIEYGTDAYGYEARLVDNFATQTITGVISNIPYVTTDHTLRVTPLFDYFEFDIIHNISVDREYSPLFITQMLDSSYITIEFGEEGNECTIPVEYLLDPQVVLLYTPDFHEGTRAYDIVGNFILEEDSYRIDNPYNCTAISNDALGFDRYHENWRNWFSQNKVTFMFNLGKTIGETLASIIFGGAGADVESAALSRDITKGMYDVRSPNRALSPRRGGRFKPGSLADTQGKLDAMRASRQYGIDMSEIQQDNANSVMKVGESGLAFIAHSADIALTPSKTTYFGTYNISLLNGSFLPVLKIYKRKDYDKCAWYYHMNGYLLCRPLDSNYTLPKLVESIENRYVFNVMKLSNLEISIDVLCPDDVKSDIVDRLLEGIRFWNPKYAINTTNIDNLEVKYL